MIIDIGVFAHNEADSLPSMLSELLLQDIFENRELDILIHVLANGCTDETVPLAREIGEANPTFSMVVHDDPEGGKSRTWNRFVHDLSRDEADILLFCDADIRLPQKSAMRSLVEHLDRHPAVLASSSRAVKDIEYDKTAKGIIPKVLVAAAGTLSDWKTAIVGSLYVARADCMREIHMPIGLPVEDGFLRGMVATDLMRTEENLGRISTPPDVFHIYESYRTIGELINHQVRIVIGSSINRQIFGFLASSADPKTILAHAARDPDWLPTLLRESLPTTSGWVSPRFLFKRLTRWRASPRVKKLPIVLVGFCFDALVYLIAQVKMARGAGAGHW